jgi:hypothetical protein
MWRSMQNRLCVSVGYLWTKIVQSCFAGRQALGVRPGPQISFDLPSVESLQAAWSNTSCSSLFYLCTLHWTSYTGRAERMAEWMACLVMLILQYDRGCMLNQQIDSPYHHLLSPSRHLDQMAWHQHSVDGVLLLRLVLRIHHCRRQQSI